MSSGIILDDIIMNMMRNKTLQCNEEEVDCFLQIFRIKIYIYSGGHYKTFTGIKALVSV